MRLERRFTEIRRKRGIEAQTAIFHVLCLNEYESGSCPRKREIPRDVKKRKWGSLKPFTGERVVAHRR